MESQPLICNSSGGAPSAGAAQSGGQSFNRQIINALVPQIFQNLQRNELPEPECPLTLANCIMNQRYPAATLAVTPDCLGYRTPLNASKITVLDDQSVLAIK